MNLPSLTQPNRTITSNNQPANQKQDEPVLCPHCRRTASNGIKCKGICVADNDY